MNPQSLNVEVNTEYFMIISFYFRTNYQDYVETLTNVLQMI